MSAEDRFSCFIIGSETHLIPCAETLIERDHQVLGIISPSSPIADWANQARIPHIEPGPDLKDVLGRQPFDYLFSIANFSIIPDDILALPRKGAVNFHDGPLPGYAGLHVTSWALINQEETHSIIWHLMTSGVDEGDILKQRSFAIGEGETTFTLNAKCYEAAIDSFAELVDELASGRAEAREQNPAESTYFSKYERPQAACMLFWSQPAENLDALVRALDFGHYTNPLGMPKLTVGNEVFIVAKLDVLDAYSQVPPGTITVIDDNGLTLATASHDVVISSLLTTDGLPLSIADLVERFDLREGGRLADLDSESAARLTALNGTICRHETFWLKRLANLNPIELPYAKHSLTPDSPVQLATAQMSIPTEVDTFLANRDDVANRSDFLAAAFSAYLARLTGSYTYDLRFSHSGLQQELAEFEAFFATHVPLHVDLDLEASLDTALDIMMAQLVKARKRKTYARDIFPRHPDLRSRRVNGGESPLPVSVAQVDSSEDYTPPSDGELTLVLSQDGTVCHWVYDATILDEDSIASMQRQFVTFLQHAAANSDQPLTRTPLLTDEDYHQLIVKWNDTQVDYPRDLCIHQVFEAQAERTPDAVAVVFEDQFLTYDQLNQRANQLAHHLRNLGVGPETYVGIFMERSLDIIVGLLGILKAGGAYVPLDPDYPAERIAFMVEDARIPVLLTQARLDNALPEHQAQVVYIDADWVTISAESKENCQSGVIPDNLSYAIYTSGSTGKPKGVMIRHRNVLNFFAGMDECIWHDPPGVWLAVTSLSFDISVLELFWTLGRGFKVVIFADKTREQALADGGDQGEDYSIAAQIRRHHVTHFQCTPSMASMLLMDDEIRASFGSIQTMLVGGEALSVSLAAELTQIVQGDVINMYGPTETTVWSSTYMVDGDQSTIPIGRPIANTQMYILDHHLQPVPVGLVGELLIGGDGVGRGYLNRPELTAERFIADPFSEDSGARLYRTGDLARYRPDGNIEFLGRSDFQVKIRGHRIELGEIETLLAQHPTIRETVVMAREDVPGDKRLVAYLIPSQEVSSRSLRDYLGEKLPEFMIPSHFVTLDAFPLTPNQKTDRKSLPAPDQGQIDTGTAYVPPKDDLEQTIALIWQRLLGVPTVGTNDNFFDLGGHSLLIVQAHSQLRKEIDRELSLTDMFRFPTVRALAAYLSEDSGNGGATTAQASVDRASARREAMKRRQQRRKN